MNVRCGMRVHVEAVTPSAINFSRRSKLFLDASLVLVPRPIILMRSHVDTSLLSFNAWSVSRTKFKGLFGNINYEAEIPSPPCQHAFKTHGRTVGK